MQTWTSELAFGETLLSLYLQFEQLYTLAFEGGKDSCGISSMVIFPRFTSFTVSNHALLLGKCISEHPSAVWADILPDTRNSVLHNLLSFRPFSDLCVVFTRSVLMIGLTI